MRTSDRMGASAGSRRRALASDSAKIELTPPIATTELEPRSQLGGGASCAYVSKGLTAAGCGSCRVWELQGVGAAGWGLQGGS